NWAEVSYLPTEHFGSAPWAHLVGRIRQEVDLPHVYVGRVTDPAVAEEVLAAGHADLVGMARAVIAEPAMLARARQGDLDGIRPCIGCNDCLHRHLVEGLATRCAVNPRSTYPNIDHPEAETSRHVLVIGGGPAGLELAGLTSEKGHRVTLWERDHRLGGQMWVAGHARDNESFHRFVEFQARRLKHDGVDVEFGIDATADDVASLAPDVVVVATGAAPRVPDIDGVDQPFVVEGRDVLTGSAETGDRVLVVGEENHMQPITVAGHLVDQGKSVILVVRTTGVAPLVGRYSIGAWMAKLAAADTDVIVMKQVTSLSPGSAATKSVFGGKVGQIEGFDSVALACGGVPRGQIARELREMSDIEVHLLGDAFAPRRITYATQQASELADII
ncbi:MAG: FAD-dependent oxidoreductase, partial [Acidimicrobiales bacterium]